MKVFSSVITLLLTSAATANKAHEIISKPHISKIINKVQSASRDDDLPCTTEVEKLFECLGEECIQCFVDIILDLEEDTTCQELENSSFCADIMLCVSGSCSTNDCTAPALDLEDCAAENYPPAEDAPEPECPGLCEPSADEKAIVVEETVSKEAFVHVSNTAHDIVSKPHIAKIIKNVQEASPDDEDLPCTTEVEKLFECLGEECIQCFVDIILDLEEDTTCQELEDSSFCADIMLCASGSCSTNDCTVPALDLEDCAAENYPPAEDAPEPGCPGLCEPTSKSFAIA
eukprot:174178_1